MHSLVEGHETLVSGWVERLTFWAVHLAPPFVVSACTAKPVPGPATSPTAKHRVTERQSTPVMSSEVPTERILVTWSLAHPFEVATVRPLPTVATQCVALAHERPVRNVSGDE
jgi:hypothetical protein